MFREIFADCYVLVDGDNTYSAESAQEMVRLVIEESADMVIGDRLSSTYFTENKRPFHNTGNVLVRRLVNAFFKGSITDIMTGYRALSINFVKTFPILSGGFEIETEMTIHALDKNLLVKSLPVLYRDRPAGSASKLNTIADGTKILILIFNLFRCYKPLCFFRRCGVNTGFAGGGVFYTRFCRLCQNGPGSQVSDIYRKRDSGDIFTSVLCLRSHSGFHRKD
jgi:hypothetical protein